MLDQITPVLLTFNEQNNIARTLDKLRWARRVVVLDSFSTDRTLEICAGFPNVDVRQRAFDCFANQADNAIHESQIDTEWVLAMDADYVLSDPVVDELEELAPPPEVVGYRAHFRYCVDGKPLTGTLYPPVTVLYRRRLAHYRQDGHAHRVVVEGNCGELQAPIFHDDRKPFSAWLGAQRRYARQEAAKLRATPFGELELPDRIRSVPMLSVPLVLGYTLFVKGCILDGGAGLNYAGQRAIAEALLGLQLLRRPR